MNENAVFTITDDVFKGNIFDMTDFGIFGTSDCGDADWLARRHCFCGRGAARMCFLCVVQREGAHQATLVPHLFRLRTDGGGLYFVVFAL